MLSRRSWLEIGIAAVLLIGTGGIIFCTSEPQSGELLLSDYPELFERDALIVVGENASQIELESAEAIAANLKELARNEPIIKVSSEVSENDKSDHNLILVGTPNSNNLLQEVYDVTNATRVTKEYPGEKKGILEILRNPWDEERSMLLVAGSDGWGVKAGSGILRYVKALEKDEVIVDWEHLADNKQAVALGLVPSEFSLLDAGVRGYFTEKYPFLLNWTDFPIYYERVRESEDQLGTKVFRVEGRFELPSPTATFRLYDGEVELMSEGVNRIDDA